MITVRAKEKVHKFISNFYKKNFQTRKETDLSAYYKVDLAVLLFINITSYC